MLFPGDEIPSHLSLSPNVAEDDAFGNMMLRIGTVVEIVDPSSPNSFSQKVTEYTVIVQHRANGTAVSKAYHHCTLINTFSGLADQCKFTLRTDSKAKYGGLGSKVLLLCINGETSNAVILGGIRDDKDTQDLDYKDSGHYYHWVFNGISVDINKDGEVVAVYNGKTTVDGKVDSSVDSETVGSSVSMEKDGKVKIKPTKALEVGKATDYLLLGSTFRDAQKTQNNKLRTEFQTLQTLLNTAATALQTAGSVMVTPVSGAVLAAPQITLASQMLLQAASCAQRLGQAVGDFESNGESHNSYLSDRHKSD